MLIVAFLIITMIIIIMLPITVKTKTRFYMCTLSLSRQEDLDASTSTSSCYVDLSQACHHAGDRDKTERVQVLLNLVYLGLPVLWSQSLAGPGMQAWRAWEWSQLASARQWRPKKDRCTSTTVLSIEDMIKIMVRIYNHTATVTHSHTLQTLGLQVSIISRISTQIINHNLITK